MHFNYNDTMYTRLSINVIRVVLLGVMIQPYNLCRCYSYVPLLIILSGSCVTK